MRKFGGMVSTFVEDEQSVIVTFYPYNVNQKVKLSSGNDDLYEISVETWGSDPRLSIDLQTRHATLQHLYTRVVSQVVLMMIPYLLYYQVKTLDIQADPTTKQTIKNLLQTYNINITIEEV